MNLKIFTTLKEPLPLGIFLFGAMGLFSANYYLMATLPGSRNGMCLLGANLTPFNIAFAALLSLMTALLVAGLLSLFRIKSSQQKLAISSFSGTGAAVGVLSTFCTFCTIPVISFFGLGISFSVFTYYATYFKFGSFILLGISLWLLEKQLRNECNFCVDNKLEQ